MDTELIEAIKTITPEMYRQTIMWGWISNIIFTVVMGVLMAVTVRGYRRLKPIVEAQDRNDVLPFRLVAGCVASILAIGIAGGVTEMARLVVAPYSYILSQIGG